MARRFTIGDNVSAVVILKKRGATFTINASATIRARLVTRDPANRVGIGSTVTIDKTATGTNLAASTIVVEFTELQTADWIAGDRAIEIEVDDSGKQTTYLNCEIVKGAIT